MGFYSAASIVEDARRHGVEVRPLDVVASAWDCTLEGVGAAAAVGEVGAAAEASFAVRMGLRYVKGLGDTDRARIEEEKAKAPFTSMEDFTARTTLAERAMTALAESGAFDNLGIVRREALWLTLGTDRLGPVQIPTVDD